VEFAKTCFQQDKNPKSTGWKKYGGIRRNSTVYLYKKVVASNNALSFFMTHLLIACSSVGCESSHSQPRFIHIAQITYIRFLSYMSSQMSRHGCQIYLIPSLQEISADVLFMSNKANVLAVYSYANAMYLNHLKDKCRHLVQERFAFYLDRYGEEQLASMVGEADIQILMKDHNDRLAAERRLSLKVLYKFISFP
jgi:hypothetical protein